MKQTDPLRRKLKQIGIALSFASFGALCMMGNLLFLPVALLRTKFRARFYNDLVAHIFAASATLRQHRRKLALQAPA